MTAVKLAPYSVAAAFVLSGAVVVGGAQIRAAPVFTNQQAAAGRTAYAKHCASCHMPDLSGNVEYPPLAGTPFMSTWGTRNTKEFYDYMSAAMPYGGPSLTEEEYTAITAYILQSNGAVAGEDALSSSTAVSIESVTTRENTSK
jgi:mono/diheme cytochrome c family protein